MSFLGTVDLLRMRLLSRAGVADRPRAPRLVCRWVTDADTNRPFCVWLDAADATPPHATATAPAERESLHM